MADTADLDYVHVVQRLGAVVGDSPDDVDSDPDFVPVTEGTITIVPTSPESKVMVNGAPVSAMAAPIVCTVDAQGYLSYGGTRGVWVVDMGSDKVTPPVPRDKAAYTITYSGLKFGTQSFKKAPVNINPDSVKLAGADFNITEATNLPLPAGLTLAYMQGLADEAVAARDDLLAQKGTKGGIAALDATTGAVLDASGTPVEGATDASVAGYVTAGGATTAALAGRYAGLDPTRGDVLDADAVPTLSYPQRTQYSRAKTAALGAIGIGAVGAVAFRFDDWEDLFASTIYPAMQARGFPCSRAQISRPLSRPGMCANADIWTDIVTWNRHGVEIWNHSATHTWADGMSIADEITTAHNEIIANTSGAVPIPGWYWPGCGVTPEGINWTTGGGDITNWSLYGTAAGRLVEATYLASGANVPGSMRRTFPHGVFHGIHPQTISETTEANLAGCKKIVDQVVKDRTGVEFQLHAGNLVGITGGNTGTYYLTPADFEALLDYVKSYFDAGQLEVLSPSGMLFADHSDNRLNLEPRGGFEDATTGDTYWGRWGATVEQSGGHSGYRFLRIASGQAGVYHSAFGVNDNYGLAGQPMRFEAWVRSNGTGPTPGSGIPKVELMSGTGTTYMDVVSNLPAVPTVEWTKVCVPFILHPQQNTLSYTLTIGGSDGVDWDDIRIVRV